MSKKALVSLTALTLFLAVPAWAQEEYPKADVFAGYSYLRGDFGVRHGDLVGGGIVGGAYHFNRYLSAAGEWSTHHDTIRGVHVDSNLFLFGPRVYFLRHGRFDSFAQALFGFHRTQVGFPVTGASGGDDTGFAFAGGVGVDVDLHDHFAWRALQVDYVTFDQNLPTGVPSQFTDNIRLSSGIVFKWGE